MDFREECRLLYKNGAFSFGDWAGGDFPFPEDTCGLLRDAGLPSSFDALGICFLSEPVFFSGGFWQVGYEWEMAHALLLEEGTGRVFVLQGSGKVLVNTGLGAFLLFLERFAGYVAKGPVVGVSTMSAAQAKDMLARFREGRLERGAAPVARRVPAVEEREMRAYFRSVDPGALGRGKWWPRVLEQVGDGIL